MALGITEYRQMLIDHLKGLPENNHILAAPILTFYIKNVRKIPAIHTLFPCHQSLSFGSNTFSKIATIAAGTIPDPPKIS